MQNRPNRLLTGFLNNAHCLSGFILPVKTVIVFFTFSLLLNTLSARQTDSLPPEHAPRLPVVDIQHIALDLSFDWSKKRVNGTANITLSPLNPTRQITLDAGFLSIQTVELIQTKGKPLALAFHCDSSDQNDNLKITLNRSCRPGETLRLQIKYHSNYHNDTDPNNLWGSYGQGLRFFEPTTTEPRKRRQIWSMGTPQGNRYWFPAWDAPGDLRTFELRATVEKPLQVVSNGQLVSVTAASGNTQTFHWKMDAPQANHQTTLIVGEYTDYQQSSNGISLHSLGYPDEQEATRASVVRLPDMLRFFSELTGYAYPYPAYYQTFVQEFPWGGGNAAGVATISENMIDDFGTHADFFYLWDGVEAQDLAAQWFGNLLTPRDWSDAWLTFSFALYMDCLYTEYKNGHDEMLLWNRNFQQNTCLGDWQAGVRRPIVTRQYHHASDMCFDNFSLRGALVLHLLRKQLGEEKWLRAIRTYVSKNAGKTVTTADFMQAVELAAGEPMDWFFEQWLFKTGHPVFEVLQQYDAEQKRLKLTVKQLQTIDTVSLYPQVLYFQGKTDIEIDGRIEQVRLAPQAENVFFFQCPKAPQLVNFDVGNTWIRTLNHEKTTTEWLYQFQNSTDIVARRAAMQQLAGIFQKEQTSALEKTEILAAFRKVIESQAYWRLRYSAILTLQGLWGNEPLDANTESMLLGVIKNERSWNRAAAITFLGVTKLAKYADLYTQYLQDDSDRVVNAAANALGKSKAEGAFETLLNLKNKPSWKNQSLISALNGLRELGDPRGAELALTALKDENAAARWTLATPVWDFRLAAAETLAALNKGDDGYAIVYQRFTKSLAENDLNDIFSNVLLIVSLRSARGTEIFPILKEKFKNDAAILQTVVSFEGQLRNALMP